MDTSSNLAKMQLVFWGAFAEEVLVAKERINVIVAISYKNVSIKSSIFVVGLITQHNQLLHFPTVMNISLQSLCSTELRRDSQC